MRRLLIVGFAALTVAGCCPEEDARQQRQWWVLSYDSELDAYRSAARDRYAWPEDADLYARSREFREEILYIGHSCRRLSEGNSLVNGCQDVELATPELAEELGGVLIQIDFLRLSGQLTEEEASRAVREESGYRRLEDLRAAVERSER